MTARSRSLGSMEMPVFHGNPVLSVQALPSGFIVYQPGAPHEMNRMLCASTTLEEALDYMRAAVLNALPSSEAAVPTNQEQSS
jgi:hypothetical protein